MTYEEIVMKVREKVENADARDIFEHIAVQVNIIGEGSGAFYVEVAHRSVVVEPYDYVDRDGLVTATAEQIIAVATGKTKLSKAVESGAIQYVGNMDKFKQLLKIKLK